MLPIDYVGILTTIIDLINLWPQFKHIRDTNNTSSYSMTHIKVSLFTSILWLIYAYVKNDMVLMSTGVIGLIFTLYIFCKVTNRIAQA